MSCCAPKNIGYCSESTCRKCTVPVFGFPDQARLGGATLQQLSAATDHMMHQEPFILVTGTSYAKNGALFLQLGTQEYMAFTAHPIFPLSDVFYFKAHKYPIEGVDVSADGTVPYQSAGDYIREGDTIFLTSAVAGYALAMYNAPSPYALPQFSVPQIDTLRNFQQYGTQSGEVMRIISDTYDPSVPPNEQPKVSLTGSKAYQFQFTRIGQNLSVLPGATPAPCVVRLSEFMGGPTRLIPLSIAAFYKPSEAAPTAAANGNNNRAEQLAKNTSQAAAQAARNAAIAANKAAAANENKNGAEQAAKNASKAAQETAQAARNAAIAANKAAANNDTQTAVNAANAANRAANMSNDAANAAVEAANAAGRNSASIGDAFAAQNAAKMANEAAQSAANAAKQLLGQ